MYYDPKINSERYKRGPETLRMWLCQSGTEWTDAPIERSDADAVYCPVLGRGRWNASMQALHGTDPVLAHRWREARRRPGRPEPGSGQRATVLVLRRGTPREQWVLYCDETGEPGRGIEAAAGYARTSGFTSLVIPAGNDTGLRRAEAVEAMKAAVREHGTRLIVHV